MHPTISPLAGARVVQYLCNLPLVRVEQVAYPAQPVGFLRRQLVHQPARRKRAALCFCRSAALHTRLTRRLQKARERERERERTPTRAQGYRRLSFGRHRKGAARSRDILKSTHAGSAASEITIIGGVTPVENAPAIKIRI
jgi:hypothetical protein